MQEKYSYKSDWFYLVGFGYIVSAFFIPFMFIGIAANDQEALGYGLLIGWFALACILLGLLGHMPASFDAGEDSVTFRLLYGKVCIPYSTIRSMEVTRHYTEVMIRGDVPHYVENLHIVSDSGEYDFHVSMQIDMQEAAVHPEKLQEQFEKGMFRQLQLYIESHK